MREMALLYHVTPAAQASPAQAAPEGLGRPPGCPAPPCCPPRLLSSKKLFFCAFLKPPDLHLKQREGRECLFPSSQSL